MKEQLTLEQRRKHQMLHAMNRYAQRYNENLSEDTYQRMVKTIQNGNTQHVRRVGANRIIHKLHFDQKYIIAVYSNTTNQIVTFLPPEDEALFKKPADQSHSDASSNHSLLPTGDSSLVPHDNHLLES